MPLLAVRAPRYFHDAASADDDATQRLVVTIRVIDERPIFAKGDGAADIRV